MAVEHSIDQNGIALVQIGAPSPGGPPAKGPTTLDAALIGELERVGRELWEVDGLCGIIVTGTQGRAFSVGVDVAALADVNGRKDAVEFAALGQRVFDQFRSFQVPTVAAINGDALGGGFELALACKYRVCVDDHHLKLGLPEVNLGIVPGFGGCVRVPRLAGLQTAIEVVCSGRNLTPREAKARRLIDECVPRSRLIDVAKRAIVDWSGDRMRGYIARRVKPQGLWNRALESTPGRRFVAWRARRAIAKKAGDAYRAPLRVIELMRVGLMRPKAEAFERERELLGELLTGVAPGSQAKPLIRLFQLRQSLRRTYPGRPDAPPTGDKAEPIRFAGVLGAGLMGGGIAHHLSMHGVRVRLGDTSAEALSEALLYASRQTKRLLSRGRLSQQEALAVMDRIAPGLSTEGPRGFDQAGLVIEAVSENIKLKRAVMAALSKQVAPDAVLATNTSSLSVAKIASACEHPERVIGMHFFQPVHVMPLVEIVPHAGTDPAVVERVFQFAKRMGRVPIVTKDTTCFLVNRLLAAMLSEACWCLMDRASVRAVDAVMRGWGMPLGPFELIDRVGVPIALEVLVAMEKAHPERFPRAGVLSSMRALGLYGQRRTIREAAAAKVPSTRKSYGFYRDRRLAGVVPLRGTAPELPQMLSELRTSMGYTPGPKPSPLEIEERIVGALLNEAMYAINDGVVGDTGTLDAAMVYGAGFPAFRGGPFWYGRILGHDRILGRLERWRDALGPRFTPAKPFDLKA